MSPMKASLAAVTVWLAAALASAQSQGVLEQQVARGVADLSRPRAKQLASGEWWRERLEIDLISQSPERPDAATAFSDGVVRARIVVRRSPSVSESMARAERSPIKAIVKRYEVEMRFTPDAAYGQWVFVGGRYWILDDQATRRLELTMFPDLLRDAPLDAPHELAWAIMSP